MKLKRSPFWIIYHRQQFGLAPGQVAARVGLAAFGTVIVVVGVTVWIKVEGGRVALHVVMVEVENEVEVGVNKLVGEYAELEGIKLKLDKDDENNDDDDVEDDDNGVLVEELDMLEDELEGTLDDRVVLDTVNPELAAADGYVYAGSPGPETQTLKIIRTDFFELKRC